MVWFKAWHRRRRRRRLTAIGDRSLMWVDSRHASSVKVLCANPPDYGSMMVWRRTFRPGDLFLDAGANVGSYTLWMAERGADVLALEPDPEACAYLRENVALNGYPVKVLQLALAASSGMLKFTIGLDSQNHLASNGDDGSMHFVQASTLDTLVGSRVVAGVKLDVEGAELLALQGARRALAEQRIKLLQLEWNECSLAVTGRDRRPVATLLESFAYGLFRPDDDGTLRPIESYDFGADVFAQPLSMYAEEANGVPPTGALPRDFVADEAAAEEPSAWCPCTAQGDAVDLGLALRLPAKGRSCLHVRRRHVRKRALIPGDLCDLDDAKLLRAELRHRRDPTGRSGEQSRVIRDLVTHCPYDGPEKGGRK
jgi:FkbM family methyltransferase